MIYGLSASDSSLVGIQDQEDQLFVLGAAAKQSQALRQYHGRRVSKLEASREQFGKAVMDQDIDRMFAQAQARQAGGQPRMDTVTPDKSVSFVFTYCGLKCHSSFHSGEVIHISSLALLKVGYFRLILCAGYAHNSHRC